ncbi:peptide MFS transporter [Runella sp.]|uniref:peptide MFS transporter n=1 Tax=Runella sp. TaxID=1960881 RepID=UPI003D1403EE
MPENTSSRHPNGLYLLFATEMWERFSYYGMRAILVLYLTKALFFDKAMASNIYGGYVGLVYMTPLIGGFIADRYWGNRRSILVGGLLMALGQFVLFLSALLRPETAAEGMTPFASLMLFLGLGLMITGNGFFKPNISSMVGSLYGPADRRRDAAYTIFYMGINLGSFLGNLITSLVGDTGNPNDFKWAFLACSVAMLLATLTLWWGQNKYLHSWDNKPVGATPADSPGITKVYFWLPALLLVSLGIMYVDAFITNIIFPFLILSALVIAYLVFADKSLSRIDREKVAVIFIVSFFVIFFWATFEQAPASLTFFADEQTDREIWGYTVPPSLFQNLNGFFIVTCAPLMAFLWGFLGKRNAEPSSIYKMAIGLFLVTLGYIVIEFPVKDLMPGVKVSMFYLVALYLLHSVGELCLSPIGLSLVNKLSPPKYVSLMMAVWFLAPAIANKAAGMISALYPEPGKTTNFLGIDIHNLYEFFLINVALSGIASLLLFILAGRVKKIMHGAK